MAQAKFNEAAYSDALLAVVVLGKGGRRFNVQVGRHFHFYYAPDYYMVETDIEEWYFPDLEQDTAH